MKKKALIAVPILVVIFIAFLAFPRKQNNTEETALENSVVEPTSTLAPTATPKPTPKPTATPTPESETTAEEENTEDSSVNSTHTDVVLGEDEYKGDEEETTEEDYGLSQEANDRIDAAMDEAIDNILKDYYKSNPQPTQPAQGNYESVGTPDSGDPIPEFDMTGDFSQLGDNVTVY